LKSRSKLRIKGKADLKTD